MDTRTLARLKELPRRDPLVVLAALWLLVVVAVTLAAPWLSAQDPTEVAYARALQAPSAAHPLGTDNFGRDVLVRVMHGGRASLSTAAIVVVIIIAVSVLIGAAAGYVGGWVDAAVSRVIDVLLAFPQMVLAIAIAALMGAGLGSLILAVTVVSWPSYARIFRAYVLQVKHEGYVVAARCAGTPTWKVLLSHVLGAIVGPVLVLATLDLGQIILNVASLSFLGLGIRPPTPEWGAMLNEARPFVERGPWAFLAPGAAIFLVVMSANYVSDAVRDALDPRRPRVLQLPGVLSLLRLDARRAAGARRRARAARLAHHALACRAAADSTADAATRPIVLEVGDLHVRAEASAGGRAPDPASGADGPSGVAGIADRLSILRGVSLTIRAGECLGCVGESGSGKSTLAAAMMGLLRPPLSVTGGSIRVLDEDATAWSWDDWRPVRGRHVALVSQDPLNALNPLLKIGDQIGECVRYHAEPRLTRRETRDRMHAMLDRVRLPHAVLKEYPHQLSGGMRQRVVIAMALINEPQLLIADEPTTALDVTTQARILEELAELQRTLGVAMVFISHDLRLVGKIAERVIVMREGQIVEQNRAQTLFEAPRHAYTRQLLASIPGIGLAEAPPAPDAWVEERELVTSAGD